MLPTPSDQILYTRKDVSNGTGRTAGLYSCYVENVLSPGTKVFERITEKAIRKFESKSRIYGWFDFYGYQKDTVTNSTFVLDQRHYAASMTSDVHVRSILV